MRSRTPLKMLRHFSATELLTAGVDLRTVAGRLGHGGGGTTTLKIYAAWVSAADQRAALAMLDRMPGRRVTVLQPGGQHADESADVRRGYELIAESLRSAIAEGTYPQGTELPTVKELAALYSTTVYQAHQAIQVLRCRRVRVRCQRCRTRRSVSAASRRCAGRGRWSRAG